MMEDSYQSQEALIRRRAQERNVDLRELQVFFEKKILEICTRYPDPSYSCYWRLSKVEYLVWERFFPTEPFPGNLQYKPAHVKAHIPSKPMDPTSMAWIHDKYNPTPQPSPTEEASLRRGSEGHDLEARRLVSHTEVSKMNRQLGDHYSPPPKQSSKPADSLGVAVKEVSEVGGLKSIVPQGPNAHRRLTQAEIAAHDARYPSPLTYKEQLMSAGEAGSWFHPNAQRGQTKYKDTTRGTPKDNLTMPIPVLRLGSKPIQVVGDFGHARNSSGTERDSKTDRARVRQEHGEPGEIYLNQENLMERRAIQGGFRGEMFAYLQKARDNARATHGGCSRYMRGYLSDKKTWEHFWPKEHFPGIEPRSGHTARCLMGSRTGHGTGPIPKTSLNARPVLPISGPSKSGPAFGRLSPVNPATFQSSATVSKVKIEPSVTSVNLQAINKTPVTVTPQPRTSPSNGVGSGTMDRLIDQLSTPRNASRPMSTASNIVAAGSVSDSRAQKAAAVTPAAQAPSTVFQDPDEMWKIFKSSFRVSDSDRSQVEKNVKAQGGLRLVLDEASGQMVTVEELIKRTQYRYALSGKLKRKAEDDNLEKERAQKRAANFLDSLLKQSGA